jgi:hypothetical protein
VAEKLVVRVDASAGHPEHMTVQDVFAHVLDLFHLVDESDPENQGQIIWRLLNVTMNSPLTVTAEAVPIRPEISLDQANEFARKQLRAFNHNFSELRQGRFPKAWSSRKNRDTVASFLARNRNGIGSTKINSDIKSEIGPLVITPEDARAATVAVVSETISPRKIKDQVGSFEGTLLQIASYYGHPAIQISERKSKAEIWCQVPNELIHEFSLNTSAEDVWKGSRVVVRGVISRLPDGKVARMMASSIRRIESKTVSDDSIKDKSFTGNLTTQEYLDRLMDGTLG